jgi:hypothetical protein
MFELLKSADVTPEDAVTAAYNAIRILQYRKKLRPTGYLRFLRGHESAAPRFIHHENTSSERRLRLAIQLINEIEVRERTKLTKLEPKIARKYQLALASAANKRAEVDVDLKRSKTLLKQLEKETASITNSGGLTLP